MTMFARVPAFLSLLIALPAWAGGPIEQEKAIRLNDAQVVGVLKTANDLEIKGGSMAAGRASTSAVKAYARMLVEHHEASNAEIAALRMPTETSEPAHSLIIDAQSDEAYLKSLKGKSFDIVFLAHSIKMHGFVLHLIDSQLLPSASSSAVVALLRKSRPVIQSHLDQAKRLQADLNR